ncbi:MAG TPA: hypothetical protein VFS32_00180 [Candidatus Limnocylindrales bacterium]|nr:hypothetical protein [Candidatus Limnocylindrales bacterium]
MTSDFDWWLLLVGIVVGAGLAWLVVAEFGPSAVPDPESEQTELQLEADWIAARFEERGATIDRALLADALELDRLYRTPDIRLAPTRPRTPVGGTAAAEGEEESSSG